MTALVVDLANVMGARPDGWWRDRAGAAERLLAALVALPAGVPGPDGGSLRIGAVVAVVEGAARAVPEPVGVRLVRAPGSGDDALVAAVDEIAAAGEDVLVVTADRGLRARLPGGVRCAGPGWLRQRLDAGDGMTDAGPG
ncbi:hypothetical protein [Blastococcus atacamensis]|uniref:hypothetical protein n=1 Tax=Blastococcus atacamensis TaxID=2070508 RepID=UPI000CEBB3C2|nr:hypothetical protein [Blastococcus atacamensis]